MTPNRGARARAGTGVAAFAAVALLAIGLWAAIAYRGLVRADEQVRAQREQVEAAHQRRNDAATGLLDAGKRASAFERQAFIDVVRARAEMRQLSLAPRGVSPPAFARAQEAQDQLGAAAARLVEALESYPEIRADPRFRSLKTRLVATGFQIAQERARFNQAAQAFNARRSRFPAVLLVPLFGDRFAEKPYFHERPGAEAPAPIVL